MKSKRGEFNFVLLFAIIAGSAILLLSIYGAMKTGNSLQVQQSAEASSEIASITDPLQAGFATASSSSISFKKDTQISNYCDSFEFGYNEIFVQSKSSAGDEWLKQSEMVGKQINNKYIFSEYEEGKKFYVLSKSFELPFKVADLLFITSQNYCLAASEEESNDVVEEMLSLGPKNIGVKTLENDTCLDNSIKVCFGYGSNCNITVIGQCSTCKSEYDYGIVRKGDEEMFYVGNLLYAAIFSDKENYECNVQRLLFRTSKIAQVLSDKADLMNARGCNTNSKQYVDGLRDMTAKVDLVQLKDIYSLSRTIEEIKESSGEDCSLW